VRGTGNVRRGWLPLGVAAGQTVVVGLAAETDTALAATHFKTRSVGLAAETDTALAARAVRTKTVGLAAETDTALPAACRCSAWCSTGMGREAQPYRKGPRQPGFALDAMLKGRTASGFNPKDIERNVQRLVRAGKRGSGRIVRRGRIARRVRRVETRVVVRGARHAFAREGCRTCLRQSRPPVVRRARRRLAAAVRRWRGGPARDATAGLERRHGPDLRGAGGHPRRSSRVRRPWRRRRRAAPPGAAQGDRPPSRPRRRCWSFTG
jgi:hypothetical protein